MEPLRHANTMPPQGLTHQRSVARKPVGKPSVAPLSSPQTFSLAHRPAPQQQQQYPSSGYPPHNQQQQIQPQIQKQRPQSYHPGQSHLGHLQQSPNQIHNVQPVFQPAQSTPHQPAQPAQHLPQQQQHQGQYSHQPHPQPLQHQQQYQSPQQSQIQQQSPISQQQVQTQPQQPSQQHALPQQQVQAHISQQQLHQQSPILQQHTHQSPPQQQTPSQYPQQQPFSPIASPPNIANQTAPSPLANAPQTPQPQPQPQPQTTPASPTPQLHHNDPGHANIGSFVADHGRPASIGSSPGIATPATTIASVASPSPITIPAWDPASPPPIQQTPTVEIRRTSTGQPKLCNHCRKGIPLNVSVYTCLICSTANIATNFCVWCFTSNAVNTSHSHDKSYYATESDPRVQSSVQDATTHMWTIRKNVSGRLWYTHNTTGLKTHLKPTTAALSGFSGLPPGWDERRTPDGRTFYFNKRMGTSAWTKPANSLPEGWKELRTPDAVPFYVNEQLGLSTWDRPGQQPKQGNKVVIRRRPGPGQPMTSQNVGDNLLSATINAARLTGQGVESASRQVGKLGKRKNWRKLGRMLNQVNGMTGDNSGSDGEYNDYNDNDNSGFGFGDDSGGFQDQQQGQFQQGFDSSFLDQPQQSFDLGDSQQQAMFQQPAYEQQTTFEYSVQSDQPGYDMSTFEQQPGQFSITTEVSYTTAEPQPTFEQQSYEPQQDQFVQQPYEQQSSFEIQQQTTFEPIPAQDSTVMDPCQQAQPFEPVPTVQQIDCPPPALPQETYVQPTPQPMYQPELQQTYSTQQYTYDPTQAPQMTQQQVTVTYQVPTYATEPAQPFILQSQAAEPVYPIYIPNNQPEIITSDAHLVEVPGTDDTTLILNSGYGGNDILAGTSLAPQQNTMATQAPQDPVVNVTTQQSQSQSPVVETTYTPAPVVQPTAGKTETVVSVDAVPVDNFNTAERCNQLI